MLAARVKLIEQSNVHRLAQDQLDHESKEEIFQHKMQAYDKVVFTVFACDIVFAFLGRRVFETVAVDGEHHLVPA